MQKLTNVLKPLKEDANLLEKFWHWTKHTTIKSTKELSSQKASNLRTVCQIGNLLFSLMALGAFIPTLNRIQTKRKDQLRKQQQANNDVTANKIVVVTKDKNGSSSTSSTGAASKVSELNKKKNYEMDILDKKSTAFGKFFNS